MSAGAVGRFAGQALLRRIGGALRDAVPRGGEAVLEFAPNLLFAGSSALMAPEGTDLGTRIGAGVEDLVGNGLLDIGLRAGGGEAARAIARRRGRSLSPETESMVRSGISMVGGLGVNMAGLMPRPFMNKAYADYEARFDQEQQQQLALRDEAIRQQLIQEMGGYAQLAEPAISAGFGFGVDQPLMGVM